MVQKKVPAKIEGTGILAIGLDFKNRSIIGLATESEVQYVRASRIVSGVIKPETAIGTDIIKDGIAYFVGVEPGEYVFTDIVFSKSAGSPDVPGHDRISFTDTITKYVVALTSEEDSKKTVTKVDSGSISYMNKLSIRADGQIRDFWPDFDEEKASIKKIRIDKGYRVYNCTLDDTMGAQIVKVIKDEKDVAFFEKKSRELFAGTEWSSVFEPKVPSAANGSAEKTADIKGTVKEPEVKK
jgi:hypothetical protein